MVVPELKKTRRKRGVALIDNNKKPESLEKAGN